MLSPSIQKSLNLVDAINSRLKVHVCTCMYMYMKKWSDPQTGIIKRYKHTDMKVLTSFGKITSRLSSTWVQTSQPMSRNREIRLVNKIRDTRQIMIIRGASLSKQHHGAFIDQDRVRLAPINKGLYMYCTLYVSATNWYVHCASICIKLVKNKLTKDSSNSVNYIILLLILMRTVW